MNDKTKGADEAKKDSEPKGLGEAKKDKEKESAKPEIDTGERKTLKRYKLPGLKDNTVWLRMSAAIRAPDGSMTRVPGISITVKNEFFETGDPEIQGLMEKKYPKALISDEDWAEMKKLEVATLKAKPLKAKIQTGPTRVIK